MSVPWNVSYKEIVARKAKWGKNRTYSYKKWKKHKKDYDVACSVAVSYYLQAIGCLADGKCFSHTTSSKSKKNTKAKAMYGYKNLKNGKLSPYIGKKVADLPKKYKVEGAVFVYDSDIGVYTKLNKKWCVLSCNKSGLQTKSKVVHRSGSYQYTQKVLYVFIPNEVKVK